MIMQSRVINFTSKTSSRIIYQSKKVSWYIWLLIFSKFLRCSGVYLAFDVLQTTHVINFVWILSLICCLLFWMVQRPLAAGKEVPPRGAWLHIARHALLQNCILVLFFYALSRVGPFRAVLLSEHSDVVLLAVAGAVFKGSGGPRKSRGALCFLVALLSLFLFDNDVGGGAPPAHPEGGRQHDGARHAFFYVVSWMGLSDHEGGLALLVLCCALCVCARGQSRRAWPEVGGAKRFNALAWGASAAFMSPCVLLLSIFEVSSVVESLSSLHLIFVVALLCFAFDYYVSASCSHRLSSPKVAQMGTLALLASGLALSLVWPQRQQQGAALHRISGGAFFSLGLFAVATLQLTVSDEDRLPSLRHRYEEDALSRPPSSSFWAFVSTTFQSVLADKNSRTIFYFLCINLGFTLVELCYGVWTNSLGLLSDGFHMLFDCSALILGLAASVMAQWRPNKRFPFGYGRIEVLSGFVNGLFLCVIALMIFLEALERVFEPPQVRTERLLAVAVCGLAVNLCGILAFSATGHGHSHGASHSHSHHGHSHAKETNHSHSQGHSYNANMQGVLLHIVADTLGSVAVIVSSVLIERYGWLVADPLCSLALSLLILASAAPLIASSARVLILGVPARLRSGVKEVVQKILAVESVLCCDNAHFWEHCEDTTVASINVYITGEVPEQRIMHKVTSILQGFGFSHISVQIEVWKGVSGVPPKPASAWSSGTVFKARPRKRNETPLSIRDI